MALDVKLKELIDKAINSGYVQGVQGETDLDAAKDFCGKLLNEANNRRKGKGSPYFPLRTDAGLEEILKKSEELVGALDKLNNGASVSARRNPPPPPPRRQPATPPPVGQFQTSAPGNPPQVPQRATQPAVDIPPPSDGRGDYIAPPPLPATSKGQPIGATVDNNAGTPDNVGESTASPSPTYSQNNNKSATMSRTESASAGVRFKNGGYSQGDINNNENKVNTNFPVASEPSKNGDGSVDSKETDTPKKSKNVVKRVLNKIFKGKKKGQESLDPDLEEAKKRFGEMYDNVIRYRTKSWTLVSKKEEYLEECTSLKEVVNNTSLLAQHLILGNMFLKGTRTRGKNFDVLQALGDYVWKYTQEPKVGDLNKDTVLELIKYFDETVQMIFDENYEGGTKALEERSDELFKNAASLEKTKERLIEQCGDFNSKASASNKISPIGSCGELGELFDGLKKLCDKVFPRYEEDYIKYYKNFYKSYEPEPGKEEEIKEKKKKIGRDEKTISNCKGILDELEKSREDWKSNIEDDKMKDSLNRMDVVLDVTENFIFALGTEHTKHTTGKKSTAAQSTAKQTAAEQPAEKPADGQPVAAQDNKPDDESINKNAEISEADEDKLRSANDEEKLKLIMQKFDQTTAPDWRGLVDNLIDKANKGCLKDNPYKYDENGVKSVDMGVDKDVQKKLESIRILNNAEELWKKVIETKDGKDQEKEIKLESISNIMNTVRNNVYNIIEVTAKGYVKENKPISDMITHYKVQNTDCNTRVESLLKEGGSIYTDINDENIKLDTGANLYNFTTDATRHYDPQDWDKEIFGEKGELLDGKRRKNFSNVNRELIKTPKPLDDDIWKQKVEIVNKYNNLLDKYYTAKVKKGDEEYEDKKEYYKATNLFPFARIARNLNSLFGKKYENSDLITYAENLDKVLNESENKEDKVKALNDFKSKFNGTIKNFESSDVDGLSTFEKIKDKIVKKKPKGAAGNAQLPIKKLLIKFNAKFEKLCNALNKKIPDDQKFNYEKPKNMEEFIGREKDLLGKILKYLVDDNKKQKVGKEVDKIIKEGTSDLDANLDDGRQTALELLRLSRNLIRDLPYADEDKLKTKINEIISDSVKRMNILIDRSGLKDINFEKECGNDLRKLNENMENAYDQMLEYPGLGLEKSWKQISNELGVPLKVCEEVIEQNLERVADVALAIKERKSKDSEQSVKTEEKQEGKQPKRNIIKRTFGRLGSKNSELNETDIQTCFKAAGNYFKKACGAAEKEKNKKKKDKHFTAAGLIKNFSALKGTNWYKCFEGMLKKTKNIKAPEGEKKNMLESKMFISLLGLGSAENVEAACNGFATHFNTSDPEHGICINVRSAAFSGGKKALKNKLKIQLDAAGMIDNADFKIVAGYFKSPWSNPAKKESAPAAGSEETKQQQEAQQGGATLPPPPPVAQQQTRTILPPPPMQASEGRPSTPPPPPPARKTTVSSPSSRPPAPLPGSDQPGQQ